ncbi:hypothetical protein GCM10009430_24300 [Aquimarina litoralis]|uniref:DUF3592 domain-containing protein n=1 Tax=Aquimarina litoralis TaxID=584605 RepID=A0ABN1IVF8_9FLAO
MSTYLPIISLLLLFYTLYVGYTFFVFKYQSIKVDALVILSQADKMLQGDKKAVKVGLSYHIDGKSYSEVITTRSVENVKIGSSVPVQVLKNNPQKITMQPDEVRLRRVFIALVLLVASIITSYFI